jgi:prepilin-type N-terminal cleavage/methylation domain-containing protein
MRWERKRAGFTIVELLIVVVVIAILAAITIVAYSGIRDRAVASQLQSALEQANKKVLLYAVQNAEQYPSTLADAGVTPTGSVSYQYTSDNTTNPKKYAITVSDGLAGANAYYIANNQSGISKGIAPGHNRIVWDKSDATTAPVSDSVGVTIDSSVFRTASASVRLSPGATGKGLRNQPFSGNAGETITTTLWIQTDSNWNGLGNNSKIRYGAVPSAAILKACSYNGVKTTWTEFSCSFTFTAANTAVYISVGNDGLTGSIWLDDISVSIQ